MCHGSSRAYLQFHSQSFEHRFLFGMKMVFEIENCSTFLIFFLDMTEISRIIRMSLEVTFKNVYGGWGWGCKVGRVHLPQFRYD